MSYQLFWKESMDHSGLTWKQFVDVNKIRDFFTMNSKLRIRFYKLKMKW